MAKIFSGTYATTQTLTSVAENPATIQTTGRLNAGLVGSTKDNWYIDNFGTIAHTNASAVVINHYGAFNNNSGATILGVGTGSRGVELNGGDSFGIFFSNLTNKNGGTISAEIGVVGVSNNARVTNAGKIQGSLSGGMGIWLQTGGSVTNQSGGTVSGDEGVVLEMTGHVTNQSGGSITGGKTGLRFATGSTLLNSGGISGSLNGVLLQNAGTVTNTTTGTVSSGFYGVRLFGGGTLDNAGQVSAVATGVVLADGGVVTNRSSGTITSTTGAQLNDGGTIINAGQVSASATGVLLAGGAMLTNQSGATISGNPGVEAGPGSTIDNAGVINGVGSNGVAVSLTSGALVVNTGLIHRVGTYGSGISISSGGTVTNQSTGTIVADHAGEAIRASGGKATVVNAGSIKATEASGVYLAGGGLLTNAASGRIEGESAVSMNGGSAVNAGTITGYYGFDATGVSSLTNQSGGVIGTGQVGVRASGTLTVTNQAGGTITGANGILGGLVSSTTLLNQGLVSGASQAGIYFFSPVGQTGGSITNDVGGTITGKVGIDVQGIMSGLTVVNRGLIAGTTTAIDFTSGAPFLLVVDPGASFSGIVQGGNVPGGSFVSTLQLTSAATTGTLSGLGAQVLNFGQVNVDTGASWLLPSATLQSKATLANAGSILSAVTLAGTATVTNASGALIGAGSGGLLGTGAGPVTIATAGAINGGATAVSLLAGSAHKLIVTPGASFTGKVDGGNTAGSSIVSTLQLTSAVSTGTLAGIGSVFTNFSLTEVDSGATWVLSDATITNSGTLDNAGTILSGVTMQANSTLLNQAGARISAAGLGAVIGVGVGVSINNDGTIAADPDTGFGVYLAQGGTLTNTAGASIGGRYGVYIAGGVGTVYTAGTISGPGDALSFAAGYNNALEIETSAVITGAIKGGNTLGGATKSNLKLLSSASSGTLSGLGATVTGFETVEIEQGGTWTFAASALGAGYTLTNDGTLTNQGSLGSGVTLGSVARLTNEAGATITATGHAVQGPGGPVSNSGSIGATGGTGVTLSAGGTVTNAASGTITGTDGVAISGGGGSVGNSGVIAAGGGTGVSLASGGTVTNASGATITGVSGVAITGGSGTVGNSGSIGAGSGFGASLASGGHVTNAATGAITGTNGVAIAGANGTVSNLGDITATTGTGISLAAGGMVDHAAGASIEGVYGVVIGGAAGTISTEGAISGTKAAIRLAAGFTNRLTVGVPATFSGLVDGGNTIGSGTASLLILDSSASAGTLTGLGSQFINFAQVTINSGVNWTLASAAVTAGTTLTNLGTLTNAGTLGTGVTLASGAQVINLASSTIVAAGGVSTGAVVLGANTGGVASVSSAGLIQATNVPTGRAVYLRTGGVVNVEAGGRIAGRTAVQISGGAGTVTNAGALAGTVTGLQLAAGFANQLNLLGGASLSGQIDGGNTLGSTISSSLNLKSSASAGTLSGIGTQVVRFEDITVEAGADWTLGGTIGAGYTLIDDGTLTNTGTILTHPTLGAGAVLINATGATIATGGTAAVYGHASGTNTIVNAGLITASSDGTIATRGISLSNGGLVTNQSGGIIAGSFVAIEGGKNTTVVNDGQIGNATANLGIAVSDALSVTNQAGGTIAAQFLGVGSGGGISGGPMTVVNAGLIAAGTASGRGVDLSGPATVTNAAGGTISGATGVALSAVAGTVDNAGLIGGGSAQYGVKLGAGGVVINAASGTISGQRAVTISGGAGSVVNAGFLGKTGGTASYGVQLRSGGSVANVTGGTIAGQRAVLAETVSAAVVNAGVLAGGQRGVALNAGGTVTNQSGGSITGQVGVQVNGATGTVDNSGRITGITYGTGVLLANGGAVTNRSGGTITGYTGVRLQQAADVVVNAGAIQGGGDYGVRFDKSGALTNKSGGVISGVNVGVILNDGGTIDNQAGGTISGDHALRTYGSLTLSNAGRIQGTGANQTGVYAYGGGTITNLAGGTIAGLVGVSAIDDAATVVNAGAISASSQAIDFHAGHAHRLVVQAGASFTGAVDGGNTIGSSIVSTLQLASSASAGTLSGVGSQVTHFRDIVVDAGADWTLAAASLGNGYKITNKGTLTNTGSLGSAVTMASGAVLTNATTGTIASGTGAVVDNGSGPASVDNAGVIAGIGSAAGIYLGQGGTVVNRATGTITGHRGFFAYYEAATVTNAGTITGVYLGVGMSQGGSVTNQTGGTIAGSTFGVYIINGAALTNESGATITGTDGVFLQAGSLNNAGVIAGGNGSFEVGAILSGGGPAINQAGGTISGSVGMRLIGGAGTVTNGGIISGTTAAVQFTGGFANRLIVNPGGSFSGLVNGGNTIGSTISSTLQLASAASSGTISALGTQFINFANTEIDAGASWALSGSNTIAAGASLTNLGTLTLLNASFTSAGSVTNNGTIIIDPSVMTVASLLGTGHVEIDADSTLITTGTVSAGQTIVFTSGTGTLVMDAVNFAGDVQGFGVGDVIDLEGITDATSAGIINGNTLEVQRGGNPALHFELEAGRDFSGAVFNLGFDDDSHFLSTDLACFVTGTLIETTRGPVPVEALREGDTVRTASGQVRPVRWIGWRRLDLGEHPQPSLAQPIRVRCGAFGPALPRRDLLLSPDHALFVDGVLVPVRLLVNGATITRETAWLTPVTYFHVELDAHDILLAEGLPAESYLDTGNRGVFQNGGSPVILHPDLSGTDGQSRRVTTSCAPFVDQAERVEPIWRRLLDRAGALGITAPVLNTTADPALRVVAGGRTLRPVSATGGRWVFALPAGAADIRLLSRATAPHETRPFVEDRRRLGVMIRRLTLRRANTVETLPMDYPGLGDGWWALEQDAHTHWRWTNGDAAISLPVGAAGLLEIDVAGTVDYFIGDAEEVTRAA